MKKRGVLGIVILIVVLFSIISVATMARPAAPKPLNIILKEEIELNSNMSQQEKEIALINISETYKEEEEKFKNFEQRIKSPEPIEKDEGEENIEESIALRGEQTPQDYTIKSVAIDPSSEVADVKICNVGTPIQKIDENMLAVSIMLEHDEGYVEIARWKPMYEFDSSQCADTKVSMKAIYYKYDLKRGQSMKLLVDADGRYKENNENNNEFMYALGSDRVVDGIYSVTGPVKKGPLSPELGKSQTAAIFEEGACSDITISDNSHKVCLISDNFLLSKLTIDDFEDSIIHLWSWDWFNAKVNDIEVETSGEFFIFTQV